MTADESATEINFVAQGKWLNKKYVLASNLCQQTDKIVTEISCITAGVMIKQKISV